MTTTDWRDDALCLGSDPGLWDFDLADEWRKGAAICQVCPVRVECVVAAIEEEVDGYGQHARAMIRGGYTPKQRSRIAAGKPPGVIELGVPRMTRAVKRSHSRWNKGHRDPETALGERRYQAARHRNRRAARRIPA